MVPENLGGPADVGLTSVCRRLKVMPDEASVRQDSLRQDSLRQRVAYRAPGFERSCA